MTLEDQNKWMDKHASPIGTLPELIECLTDATKRVRKEYNVKVRERIKEDKKIERLALRKSKKILASVIKLNSV